jgi:bifunctional UDP-N-acetylglucosamine pyrophosphorylase/glucosamine-1-phosphate N-acetyltransferase
MSTKAAVVLAAGKGTRMKSALPKMLHRVCGKEMVALVVEAAGGADVDSTVVVVPPDSEAIRSTLGDSVAYVEQTVPLGSGDALRQARDILQGIDYVAVLHGDVPLIRGETLAAMAELHRRRGASVTLLTGVTQSPDGLGRVVRDSSGSVTEIVEDGDADEQVRLIDEINAGIYWFRSEWLWRNLDTLDPSPGGEVQLPELVRLAATQGEIIADVRTGWPAEVIGVNTRVQLAEAEGAMRQSVREKWMLAGVTMREPSSVYLDVDVEIGQDTVLHPNIHLSGATTVGRGCEIGPDSTVRDSRVGAGCTIVSSLVTGATLRDDVEVGPFSHIRPGSHLESGVKIGSFGEVSRSRLGRGTRSGHFSYIGDAEIGAKVNIGAGTVTCNFDGVDKHRTRIGDGAFIGSSSMLVAPITIGARSRTGAGSVVTCDVPPDSLAVGVPARARDRGDA